MTVLSYENEQNNIKKDQNFFQPFQIIFDYKYVYTSI